jgi:hypothetical protein
MNAVNHDRESQASTATLQSNSRTPSGWDPFEVWQRFFQQPRAQHDAQTSSVRYSLVTDLSAARTKLRITPTTIFLTP